MTASKGFGGRTLLIIARGAEGYGVKTKLLSLAGELAGRGWHITVYAVGDGDFADCARNIAGVTVHVDPAMPRRFTGECGRLRGFARLASSSVAFARNLRGFLRRHYFTATIFCEHGLVLPIAVAARGQGSRVFWLMPDVVSDAYPLDLNRRLYQAAFAWSGMIPVANSRYTRRTLGRAGQHSDQINLGADPTCFAAAATGDVSKEGVPRESIRLAVVARLEPEKGQLQLVQAIAGEAQLAALHLVICGGPAGSAYDLALRDAARTGGVADRVHLIGPVADPLPYYQACDLVASVRTNVEPFGLSIVEAMLAAKPVLAHSLGGPADIVVDGETGWLIDDVSADGMRAGLVRAMADRERWAKMGEAGRARALKNFTVANMTDQLLAVFDRHGLAITA